MAGRGKAIDPPIIRSSLRPTDRKSNGYELDAWLCSLARAENALPPYLTKLASSQRATLAVYVCNANALIEHRLNNPFWEEARSEAKKEIVDFFCATEISLLILQSYGVDLNLPPIN